VRDNKWEAAEIVMRMMGRRILGAAGKTPNELVRGELGWWTMKGRRDMIRLKYWGRLVRMDENRLTKRIYRMSRKRHRESSSSRVVDNWSRYTHSILTELGLERVWESEEIGKEAEWNKRVKECIARREQRDWWRGVMRKKKLETYRKYKRELKRETYLDTRGDVTGRQILTRLRGGCAGLAVEMGRRCGKGADGRICQLCERAQENETHFVLDCPSLEEERKEWFAAHDELARVAREKKTSEVEIRERVQNRLEREPRRVGDRSRREKIGLLFGQAVLENQQERATRATMTFARKAMAKRRSILMNRVE
jgi:hypothetical protein